jgi:hypothetical protein
MIKTVDFINSDNVVELRSKLRDNCEYVYLDHTLSEEYTISVDGKCRVLHEDGFDMIITEDEDREVELVAVRPIMIAQTGVPVPDWDEAYKELQKNK